MKFFFLKKISIKLSEILKKKKNFQSKYMKFLKKKKISVKIKKISIKLYEI